ncbi:amino acid ABC transporter substrate-binding protein [Lentzea sp. CA-135723]|uniref:amino acid ABC transporter substrate-binding protein n=1 Tax=Lentzea sp. CA-135723 TaxID=3239950 RepID=UPI003D92B1B0
MQRRIPQLSRRTLLLGTGAVLLSACGSGASGAGGTGLIRIGASLPLTGPVADVSKPGYQGYQAWQKKINASGGLLGRQVEFVVLDDGFDQNTVVANYNRLISQDRVDLLLGTFSSFLNLPASTVAERHGMLYIEPSGGAAEIFERGLKRLFFAQPGTTEDVPDRFVDYITSLPAADRPATAAYSTQNDPSADVPVKLFQERFEKLGIRTVHRSDYPAETANFDTLAAAIGQAAPDLVVHGAVTADGVGMIRSFQKVGFSPKFLFQTKSPSDPLTFPDGIGTGNTEGIFTTAAWHPSAKTPGNAEFVAAYKAQFNEDPTEDAASSYTATQVLEAGVQAVGRIDQDAIAEWLHANSVPTVSGTLAWDERGVPKASMLLVQWQKEKIEVVAPAEAATTSSVVRPKPGWTS